MKKSIIEIFKTEFPTEEQIKSKIRQRRSQMLVHSYLYYQLDNPIISDDQWQQWAEDLRIIQEKYKKYTKINFFDYAFKDWDGTTGFHLPFTDSYVIKTANRILKDIENDS